jgi:hypothetical protein
LILGKGELMSIVEKSQTKELAVHFAGLLLDMKIRGQIISASDEFMETFDLNGNLIGYMVPYINENHEIMGHINLQTSKSDAFFSIDEDPSSYARAKACNEKITFLAPSSYARVVDGALKELDNETEIIVDMTFLDGIYKNISRKKTEKPLLRASSAVETEDYRLTDEEHFVNIEKYYYGGSQEWFSDSGLKNTGCGPTAAANITAHMASKTSWGRSLYGYNINFNAKTDFAKHMDEVAKHVSPLPLIGMPSYSAWASSVVNFASSRGVSIHPYYQTTAKTLDNTSNYIKSGLSSGMPVALLMYYNPKLTTYSWHWMTITKYFRDGADNRYIAVSTWGQRHVLNWKWVFENSLFEATVFFLH